MLLPGGAQHGYLDLDPEGYDRGLARWTRRVAGPFLDFVGLPTDALVLEAGAGTGSLTSAALSRLGTGELHACDLSPRYMSLLRRRVADSRLHLHVADARCLPLPSHRFDCVLSLLMLNFAGPVAAAEMIRVLRPGGCFAAGVLDLTKGATLMRLFFDRAGEMAPEAAEMRRRILGAELCSAPRTAAVCRTAGLTEVKITSLSAPIDYEDFDDYWRLLSAPQGPTGLLLSCLDAAGQADLQQSLRADYLGRGMDGPRREMIGAWAIRGEARPSRGDSRDR